MILRAFRNWRLRRAGAVLSEHRVMTQRELIRETMLAMRVHLKKTGKLA